THPASTRAGLYNCKYEFSMEYNVFGAWGHASDTHQKGVWVIPGSFEFFNDGPTKQDLILAESYTLIHLGRNHYNGSSTTVPAGTAWSKIYGPWLLYCNSGANADACWADAQAKRRPSNPRGRIPGWRAIHFTNTRATVAPSRENSSSTTHSSPR
ncbi:MAG: hypothetical protein ACRETL_11915, partial [Gammaproteobacteria bacterium]